ncbi:hypothetical protein TcG_05323 [Trypanosoma cruzi]|nr:hypothetical protein TcG_05323 [Trypanosoma cruzi]
MKKVLQSSIHQGIYLKLDSPLAMRTFSLKAPNKPNTSTKHWNISTTAQTTTTKNNYKIHTALQRPTQMPRPTVRRDTALALGHFNWDGPASVKAWHPTQQALSGAAAEKRGKGGSEEAPIMRMLFCISLRARCTRRWRTSTSSR